MTGPNRSVKLLNNLNTFGIENRSCDFSQRILSDKAFFTYIAVAATCEKIYNACACLLYSFHFEPNPDWFWKEKKKHTTKFGSSKIIVWGVHNPVIHSLAPGCIERFGHELKKYSEYQNGTIWQCNTYITLLHDIKLHIVYTIGNIKLIF